MTLGVSFEILDLRFKICMSKYPQSLQNLINWFSRLPGLGPKTAERLVFYLLNQPPADLEKFGLAVKNLKQNIITCLKCQNFSETNPCLICKDAKRNQSVICIVAKPQDLAAIEKTNQYQGVYHILGGTINPLEGIGPQHLKIKELVERIKKDRVREIILALNPDMEGETTTLYLKKLLKPYKIKITRLARGLPMGSDLEYADEITLGDALKGRKEI